MPFAGLSPPSADDGVIEVHMARSPWFWFGLGMCSIICASIIVVQCVVICKNMKKARQDTLTIVDQRGTQGKVVRATPENGFDSTRKKA
jgi:hypothetical protein